MTRIAKAKHPINLLGVTQRPGEPTRKYLDRFNDECLEIDGLTDSVASLCLTNGLLNEDFRKHLTTKPRKTKGTRQGRRSKQGTQTVSSYREVHQLHSPHHTNHGSLSTNRRKGILSKPRPLKERTGGNRSLYCDYHKGYGHKTQDCFDLKDALEQAIRDGKLAEFSYLIREPRRRNRDHDDEDRTRAAKRRQEPEDDDQGLTIVNVVTARNTAPRSRSAHRKDAKVLAVSSSSARSTRKHPPISFGPKDQWFDEVGESPPMVITARVRTGIVKRILVDTGADSNIMFRNVFDALGLRDVDLQTHQHGVVGLGDHFIKPDGIITLPTSLGQGQGRRTVMAEFVIL
nr:uncharacterized protein LOC112754562 [Arachis hypogaea]